MCSWSFNIPFLPTRSLWLAISAVLLAGCTTASRGSVETFRPPVDSSTDFPSESKSTPKAGSNSPWTAQRPPPAQPKLPTQTESQPRKSPWSPLKPILPGAKDSQPSKQLAEDNRTFPKSIAPPNSETDPDGPPAPILRDQRFPKFEPAPRIQVDDVASAPQIEFTVQAPPRKPVGTLATFHLAIRNAGDQPVSHIVLRGRFDDALVFPNSERHEVMLPIDEISAGEIREIPLTLFSETIGAHCCWLSVSQQKEGVETEIISKQVCVDYVLRQVDIQIVGPSQRTTGSRAEFDVTLVNTLSRAITDASIVVSYDKALFPKELSTGVDQKPGLLTWRLGSFAAGERIQLQLEFECKTPAHRALLAVELQEGSKTRDSDEASLEIIPIAGTLDLRIKNGFDPAEIGQKGNYEITVENIGLQNAAEIRLDALASSHWRILSAVVRQKDTAVKTQWNQDGNILKFDPINQLSPSERVSYLIEVEAISLGIGEMRASLTSSLSNAPIIAAEPTLIINP